MLVSEIIDSVVERGFSELIIGSLKFTDTEVNLALGELKLIPETHKNYAKVLSLLGYFSLKIDQYPQAIIYLD